MIQRTNKHFYIHLRLRKILPIFFKSDFNDANEIYCRHFERKDILTVLIHHPFVRVLAKNIYFKVHNL